MIKLSVVVHFASGKTVTINNINCDDRSIRAAISRAKRRFPKEIKVAHQVF